MSGSRKQRRDNGEGSIYWREDRQRFCGQVEVEGRRRTIYGKTKAEIQQKMLKARLDEARGFPVSPAAMTVEKLLTDWLRDVVEPQGRGRTYASYEYHSRLQLIPAIGKVKLRDLTTPQLQRLYRQLLDRGLSLKTVRNAHGVMRAALNQALAWKLVPVNVAQAVRLPQYIPPEHDTLSSEEVKRVWQAVASTRWYAFLVLLIMTGLRQGEILGSEMGGQRPGACHPPIAPPAPAGQVVRADERAAQPTARPLHSRARRLAGASRAAGR